MKTETLQYLFVASEKGEVADPALGILIWRYLEARRMRASSVFAPSRMEHGHHPAQTSYGRRARSSSGRSAEFTRLLVTIRSKATATSSLTT
jgi:hypothetical protein